MWVNKLRQSLTISSSNKKAPQGRTCGAVYLQLLLSDGDGGYVGIYTLIPIEEALNVNYVAFLESANGGVNLGVGAGKV